MIKLSIQFKIILQLYTKFFIIRRTTKLDYFHLYKRENNNNNNNNNKEKVKREEEENVGIKFDYE
jgi:hypothetical protein